MSRACSRQMRRAASAVAALPGGARKAGRVGISPAPSLSAASRSPQPAMAATKSAASPCHPQPKQWANPLASFTVNEGERSLWNGQQATHSPPARLSFSD